MKSNTKTPSTLTREKLSKNLDKERKKEKSWMQALKVNTSVPVMVNILMP